MDGIAGEEVSITIFCVGVDDVEVRKLRGVVETVEGVIDGNEDFDEADDAAVATDDATDWADAGIADCVDLEKLETEEFGITLVTSAVWTAITEDFCESAAVLTDVSATAVCDLKDLAEKLGFFLRDEGLFGEAVSVKLILFLSIATGASNSIITL